MSDNGNGRSPKHSRRTAVVVGASMAGLCAARVLSPHFGEVLVLERDSLPDDPRARRRVPQGRHPHLLWVTGARLLEGWFPGIVSELEAGGALDLDIVADFYWHQAGGVARRPTTPLRGPAMSRPLLEWTVRRRVAALPNVTLRDAATVEGLACDASATRVTGVRLDDGSVVDCDLLVDATGWQARSLAWLEQYGFERPPTSVVKVGTSYVSRVYRRTDQPERDWQAAAVIGEPSSKRLAMVLPMEGDRWILCLAGLNGEQAPTDDAGMLAYARSLESPVIAEVMESSDPLGQAVTHKFPANQRRHVERMRRFPLGWIMLGDSVCRFNPIYGQGMTVATQQADTLAALLDRSDAIDRSFTRRYFRAAGRTVAVPWSFAVGGDFVYDGTTGKKPFGTDLLNRYVDRVTVAAQHDDAVIVRFNEVAGLLRRPESLLTPAFVVRVLRAARRGPAGSVAGPVPGVRGARPPGRAGITASRSGVEVT